MIVSPYQYMRTNNIDFDRYSFSEVDGLCMRMGETAYIGVRAGLHPIEEREIIAHEIGHLADHTDTVVGVRMAECRADTIARSFLVSEDQLRQAVAEDGGTCDACLLAPRFGVSVQLMMKRIREVFSI